MICILFLLGATAGGFAAAQFGNRALWFDIVLLALVAIRIRPQSGS